MATVLTGSMAGLALGSTIAARLGPRLRRPVLAYALLELGIGVSALLVPAAIRVARSLYAQVCAYGVSRRLPPRPFRVNSSS